MTPSSESLALIKWSKPGIIYVARNRVNGKMYVGKSIKLLCLRKAGHKNSALNKTSKLPFHEAIRKYGMESFEWSIVQKCNNVRDLDEAEKWWIKSLKTLVHDGYNCATGGSGHASTNAILERLGRVKKGRPPISEETRKKMSIARTGIKQRPEIIEKRAAWHRGKKRPDVSARMKGRTVSEESRQRMSETTKRQMTPEMRERLANANRGKKKTEEQLAKNREQLNKIRKSGPEHPNFGKHLSEEHKKIISERFKGRKMSPEQARKISEAHKGKPHPWQVGVKFSEERRKKMSEAMKGKNRGPSPLKGKPRPDLVGRARSEETRAKISAAHKGKKMTPEQAERNRIAQIGKHAGPKNYWFGKTRSEETRKKISGAHLLRHRQLKSDGKISQMGLSFEDGRDL